MDESQNQPCLLWKQRGKFPNLDRSGPVANHAIPNSFSRFPNFSSILMSIGTFPKRAVVPVLETLGRAECRLSDHRMSSVDRNSAVSRKFCRQTLLTDDKKGQRILPLIRLCQIVVCQAHLSSSVELAHFSSNNDSNITKLCRHYKIYHTKRLLDDGLHLTHGLYRAHHLCSLDGPFSVCHLIPVIFSAVNAANV